MEFAFDHVHLVCKDVDGMVDWFKKIFDAERISYSADFKGSPSAVIKLGNMRVFVRGIRPGEKPDAIAPTRTQGLDHFGVTVDDVEKAAEWLKARGAEFSVLPTRGGMGGRLISFVKGPENIDIEIVGPYVGLK
jgi:catechol 2,3-dioxygenase-like lactoylglutathione lyase family enzyme